MLNCTSRICPLPVEPDDVPSSKPTPAAATTRPTTTAATSSGGLRRIERRRRSTHDELRRELHVPHDLLTGRQLQGGAQRRRPHLPQGLAHGGERRRGQ